MIAAPWTHFPCLFHLPDSMLSPITALFLAAASATASQSSELCPGGVFAPAADGLDPVFTSIGFNGDRFVVGQSGDYVIDGGPGGAKVFEVQPGTGDVVVVDEMVVPGIGRGFGREVLGAAVASSGAVLVARREPSPSPASLFQLRRSAPGASIAVTSLESTQYISWVEEQRRFDADGDRAVITSWVQSAGRLFVCLDFFGVNAAGDWFLEDTVRAARPGTVYNVRNVTLKGDQALLEYYSSSDRAAAYERNSAGKWEELALPPALSVTSPAEIALSGDMLATTHVTGDSGRVDVYSQLAPGSWALTTSIPVPATGADQTYPARLQLAGDLLSFMTLQFGPQAPERTSVYRRTSTGAVSFQAAFDNVLYRLTPDHALTYLGGDKLVVLSTDDLVGEVRICEERGFVACVPQRAGDLSYLALPPATLAASADLVLEGAPAGVPAFVLASLDRVPSTGMLDSLCISPAATLVRLPAMARTAPDGTATWRIEPDELPLAAGGTIPGAGGRWTFQAIVRTYVGTATSRAIVVQL